MADALASGASVRKDVGVQVPPSAPSERAEIVEFQHFFFTLKMSDFNLRHFDDKRYFLRPGSLLVIPLLICYNICKREGDIDELKKNSGR